MKTKTKLREAKKVELLAPAGSAEGFYGAISAGADAVYLGGSRFGARAYADNFSEEELLACIRYAHLFCRKVYLTVNTLVKDSEMPDLFDYLLPYYEAGLDGVIVQDIGVFAFIRDHFPGMELHVSTQMTLTGPKGAGLLKRMGASRIVPARELSLKELTAIKQETGLELETFIHGAMCYCYSGQCLFSSILGGRSGNRGRCAQPCRLPYSVEDNNARSDTCYPLSLKDMCTIEHLPELIAAGIDSFKIEGRMKRPEYAAGVTAIYRKYIDACYEQGRADKPFSISNEDLRKLSALYIRSERHNGYYYKHNGPEMVTLHDPSYGAADEALLTHIRKSFLEKPLTMPVNVFGKFVTGQPASVILVTEELTVTATGENVQHAQKQPITRENVNKQLSKLGDSIFRAECLEVEISHDAFFPLKQINDLRRQAVKMLEEAVLKQNGYADTRHAVSVGDKQEQQDEKNRPTAGIAVSVRTYGQLKALTELDLPVSRVYLDGDMLFSDFPNVLLLCRKMAEETAFIISMPYILRRDDTSYLETLYRFTEENASVFSGFQIRSMEGLGFLLEKAYTGEVYTDAGMYVWNMETLKEFYRLFPFAGFCIPYELKSAEQHMLLRENRLLDGGAVFEKVIYGRIPMMVTANCVARTTQKCLKNKTDEKQNRMSYGGAAALTDRYQKQFPVVLNCTHCMNVIYNSVPLSLYGEMDKWRGKCDFRLDFTLENGQETAAVMRYFYGMAKEPPFTEYTTGHEKRGVL